MDDANLAKHAPSEASPYRFRPVGESDLPLLARWRAALHVVEWWGVADGPEELAEPGVAKWIVEFDGRPFAFAQDYDPHAWDNHHFAHLPPGSRGIDQFIGEADMLGRGHGPAFVRQHVGCLFASGAPAVGTDPHPRNARARRAYEKAGFRGVGGPVATPWGEAILMECWRPESDGAPTSAHLRKCAPILDTGEKLGRGLFRAPLGQLGQTWPFISCRLY